MAAWRSSSNSRSIIRLAVVGIAFASSTALGAARGGTPEFYYQPAVGGFAFFLEAYQFSPNPTVTYSSGGTKASDTIFSTSGYVAGAQYAFSDAWAISASAGTAELSQKVTDQFGSATTKYSGMTDARLLLASSTPLGGWTLHVGVGAGLSPGKHIDANSSGDGNMLSGGTSLYNYLGLSSPLGSGNYYGFRLSYSTLMERTGNTGAGSMQDYKITGGNKTELETFIEADFGGLGVDGKVGYEFNDPVVNTYAAGNTSTYDAYKALHVGAGLQYQVVTDANLRLSYDMAMFTDRNIPSFQAGPYTQSTITLRARYEL